MLCGILIAANLVWFFGLGVTIFVLLRHERRDEEILKEESDHD